jgi:curved DNA-binding protein CbpA
MKAPTYYSTLGVAPDADRQVIRAAYKAKMMKYHPDKHRSDLAQAEAISKSLNEAFRVLEDPERRAQYDRSIGVNGGSGYAFVVRRSPAPGPASFEGSLAARLLRPDSVENMRTVAAGVLAAVAMLVWLSST